MDTVLKNVPSTHVLNYVYLIHDMYIICVLYYIEIPCRAPHDKRFTPCPVRQDARR